MKKVPFLDLSVKNSDEQDQILSVVRSVLDSGRIVMGGNIEQFEMIMSGHTSCKHAVAVSSGTEAIWLALKLSGIQSGDEVITSAMGWLATPNAICMAGGVPVFVDINDDLNISPKAIEEAITPKTKAILAVHYTGKPCKMDQITQIAAKHGLALIEDVAQAFGATYNLKALGSFGVCGAFSMNPMKLFGGIGETGVVTFNSDDWLERAKALRHNGLINQEYCNEPSLNLKPDEIQCGILNLRYRKVEAINQQRRQNAALYKKLLNNLVLLPHEDQEDRRVYYTYMIRAQNRNRLHEYLLTKGIETKIRHPILLNEQLAYQYVRKIGAMGETPLANIAKNEILCLPIHEKLNEDDIHYVAKCINAFYSL